MLDGAKLNAAILSGTDLCYANLNNILFGSTTFQYLDFRTAKGLATIDHLGPSPIHLPSIQLPQDGSVIIPTVLQFDNTMVLLRVEFEEKPAHHTFWVFGSTTVLMGKHGFAEKLTKS